MSLLWSNLGFTKTTPKEERQLEEEGKKFVKTLSSLPKWLKPSDYRYTTKGKPDPFVPFINKVVSTSKKRKRAGLTPLEKIDVTQLRVVGILWDPEQPDRARAMVELPDGKGFILKPGIIVGRNDGKVVKITPDNVIVDEEVVDIFGELKKKQVVLKLHPKKGEE
ncbi:pilus assembly protein PilP [Desulfonauticus submarinus]